MRATDFGISLPSRIFVIESRSPRVRSGSANSIHRPCPPALDGAIDGWESCEAVTFGEGACKVEVRGMYDLDHLYLRWHVRSDAAIRIKPLEPVDRLFTHDRGADTFGVYFQGSPAAGFVRRDLSGRYDGDMARTRKMNRVLTWMPVTITDDEVDFRKIARLKWTMHDEEGVAYMVTWVHAAEASDVTQEGLERAPDPCRSHLGRFCDNGATRCTCHNLVEAADEQRAAGKVIGSARSP